MMEFLQDNPGLLREFEQERRKNDIIRRLSVELCGLSSLKSKLDNILEMLDESFQLKHTMLLFPNQAGTHLQVFASRGFDREGLGAEIATGQGVIGVVALRRRKLRMTNISRQRVYLSKQADQAENSPGMTYPLPGLKNVESQVAIPLMVNNELVAVLSAESGDVNFFSREDEDFLATLSQLLAISIQNAVILDQLENKVKERTAELEAKTSELQQLNASKDRLFSIIGHDLRGPAASLQNATDLIQYFNQKGDFQELAAVGERISKAAANINFMLDGLLNWSITQTGDLRIQPERLHASDVLNEVLEVYREIAFGKQVKITTYCPQDLVLIADRNSVLTILRNVISNAIKFTSPGGTVEILVSGNDGDCIFLIRDTGIGMDAEKLESLFCLKKGRSSRGTTNEKGLGLGMMLVREFVHRNGGRVEVFSRPNEGTQVSLHFASE